MQQFVTKIEKLPVDLEAQWRQLNSLGAEGWQLVAIVPSADDDVWAYLIQPKISGGLFHQ